MTSAEKVIVVIRETIVDDEPGHEHVGLVHGLLLDAVATSAVHDRDGNYCPAFDEAVRDGGVRPVRLPPRSPNLNAYAERWMRSVKDACLAKLILVGEPALRTAVRAYVEHCHGERTHQGKDHLLLFPCEEMGQHGPMLCRERLGSLLKFYYRPAA